MRINHIEFFRDKEATNLFLSMRSPHNQHKHKKETYATLEKQGIIDLSKSGEIEKFANNRERTIC